MNAPAPGPFAWQADEREIRRRRAVVLRAKRAKARRGEPPELTRWELDALLPVPSHATPGGPPRE